jgi:hypothetical protein
MLHNQFESGENINLTTIFIEAVNNMKNEKAASQFQKMKDAYLSRKNNPEIRLPEDMSDEEYLRYMNYTI